jgi:hypothetical protein
VRACVRAYVVFFSYHVIALGWRTYPMKKKNTQKKKKSVLNFKKEYMKKPQKMWRIQIRSQKVFYQGIY